MYPPSEHHLLTSLGSFFELNVEFNSENVLEQLKDFEDSWKIYNPRKLNYKRYGLSLFSLDGSMSGEIDLDSVREYNKENNTKYNDLSFRTPTEAWHKISELSNPLKSVQKGLCRSHLLKLDEGGFFPPHRDLGGTFRLISFINACPSSLYFLLDDKKINFKPNTLYFANTHLNHTLFSFTNDALLLVLNLDYSKESIDFVFENLVQN